jgi:hypothetical protein
MCVWVQTARLLQDLLLSGTNERNPISADSRWRFVLSDGLTFDVGIEAEVCTGEKIVPSQELPKLQLYGTRYLLSAAKPSSMA